MTTTLNFEPECSICAGTGKISGQPCVCTLGSQVHPGMGMPSVPSALARDVGGLTDDEIISLDCLRLTSEGEEHAIATSSVIEFARAIERAILARRTAPMEAPQGDEQRVWIINDAQGEHVMMCPKQPTAETLAKVSEKACSLCTVTEFLLRPAAPQEQSASLAAVPEGRDTIERAAWILECYHAYLQRLWPINFDEHPYIPEIEGTAKDLRTMLAAAPSPAPVAQEDDEGSRLYGWLVRASKCGLPDVESAAQRLKDYYEGAESVAQEGEEGEQIGGSDEIVGHKTFSVEGGGFRHEPLTRGEADAIMAQVEASERRRAELMPDESAARHMFFYAWLRLKEFGWREAVYCPKDGREFEVIEAGSTGIHTCVYQGKWPNGHWWITADGDMCPSRPVLFRAKKAQQTSAQVDAREGDAA